MFYVYINLPTKKNPVSPCVSPHRLSVPSGVGVATTSPVARGHELPRCANEGDSHPAWLAWFQVFFKRDFGFFS